MRDIDMIKRMITTNFKTLNGTEIKFDHISIFIGLNGAGKTTILQSIDFLSALVKGNIEEWLRQRDWKKQDLTFYGSEKKLIEFDIDFQVENNDYRWSFKFNRDLLRNTSEKIENSNGKTLLEVKDGQYTLQSKRKKEKISFKYYGSILSQLKDELLEEELIKIKEFFTHIKSAELLSPLLMKKRSRKAKGDIGLGGEKLSAFLDELPLEKREELNERLKSLFHKFENFEVKTLRAGWKDLIIQERYTQKEIKTSSKHASDGLLRVMAILAQLFSEASILLFDEIEDGVNQEIVEELVDILLQAPVQIIVTTHSPMLLNYIDIETAYNALNFVCKKDDGSTYVRRFYEAAKTIDDYQKDMFGPGEHMQMINLVELSQQTCGGKE